MKKLLLSLLLCAGAMTVSADDIIYELVTPESAPLAAGDKIIIAAKGTALGTEKGTNDNNRAAVNVTITDDKITNPAENVEIITLEESGNASNPWLLKATTGYLYSPSANNYLKAAEEFPTNTTGYLAKITITSSKTQIAMNRQKSNKYYEIQRNSSSDMFSCYTGTQTAVNIYRLKTEENSQPVDFTGIATELNLYEGTTGEIITASKMPADIIFSSKDESVATVDENGKVTAVGLGSTTIDVMWDADENFTAGEATVTVTVSEMPQEFTVTVTMKNQDLSYGAAAKTKVWTSDDNLFEFSTIASITGSTYPTKYQNNLRIYNSNGNTIVVNAPEGYYFETASYVLGTAANHVAINGTDCADTDNTYTFTEQDTSFKLTSVKYNDNKNSDIVSMTFIIKVIPPVIETVATPVILPLREEAKVGDKVTITTATEGATIYYSVNEGEIEEYTAETEIVLGAGTTTIEAYAGKEGMKDSDVATVNYILTAPVVEPTVKAPVLRNAITGEAIENGSIGTSSEIEGYEVEYVFDMVDGIDIYYLLAIDDEPAAVTLADEPDYSAFKKYEEGQRIAVPFEKAGSFSYYAQDADGNRSEIVTKTLDKNTSGVDAIDADNAAEAEYFNLQGVRVVNPANGLYIVRRGSTVTKQLIR